MDCGMVAGALAGEEKTWRRNCLGKWCALGVATPVQQRAAVIELRTRSEAGSREGRRGISKQQGKNGMSTDVGYVSVNVQTVRQWVPLVKQCLLPWYRIEVLIYISFFCIVPTLPHHQPW